MDNHPSDDTLRAMAEHRGLRLVRSRRRKPGSGDYGKFGLTDGAGRALLGIGKDGLTASAADIEAYLRGDATGSWRESAKTTPAAPAPKPKPRATEPDAAPVRRRTKAAARPAKAPPGPAPKPAPAPPEPEPPAEPVVRPGRPADAAALVPLLNQLAAIDLDRAGLARHLDAMRRARAGFVVAERGAVVGCCAWAIVPTLHRGSVGRITVLVVDAGQRRQGIGTLLLGAAMAALAKAGCTRVEAMSDIALKNAHNFFRARQFEQTSYRFARDL